MIRCLLFVLRKPSLHFLLFCLFCFVCFSGCGSASHFGVEVNMPTIGVAKSMLVLPDSEAVTEKAFRKVLQECFTLPLSP